MTGTMTPPVVDHFAAAFSEGLGRVAATAFSPARAAAPVMHTTSMAPARPFTRYEAEATLSRFAEALSAAPFGADPVRTPSAQDAADVRTALLALARHTMDRLSQGRVPVGEAPVVRVDPVQLLNASVLLAECAMNSSSNAAVALREIREVFAAAAGAGHVPGARDVWQERRALARDFHDRVRGPLTAVLRQLDDGRGDRLTGEAKRMLAQAADGAEELVSGLRRCTPVSTLRDELRDVCALGTAQGIDVEWTATGDEATLPELFHRELALVLREALLNAFAHAAPRTVAVSLRVTRKWAHAQVRDDGAGFDVAHAFGAGPAHGLRSMSERMESVGGRLAIRSDVENGTRVDVHLPRYRPI